MIHSNTQAEYNLQIYYILVLSLIVCIFTATITATKICNFWGYELDGGTLIFPLTYVINDLITERYGFKAARQAVTLSMRSLAFMLLIISIVGKIPPADIYNNQRAYDEIFGLTPGIFIGSLAGFTFGELSNSYIMSKLKLSCRGKLFAFRALASTAIGAFIDSSIFCYFAFGDILSKEALSEMIITLTASKILCEFALMPFTIKILDYLNHSASQKIK